METAATSGGVFEHDTGHAAGDVPVRRRRMRGSPAGDVLCRQHFLCGPMD